MDRELIVIFAALVSGMVVGALTCLALVKDESKKDKTVRKKPYATHYVPIEERMKKDKKVQKDKTPDTKKHDETKKTHKMFGAEIKPEKTLKQIAKEKQAIDDTVQEMQFENSTVDLKDRIRDHNMSNIGKQCDENGTDINKAVQKARKTEDYNYSGIKRKMEKREASEITPEQIQLIRQQTQADQMISEQYTAEQRQILYEQYQREIELEQAANMQVKAGEELIHNAVAETMQQAPQEQPYIQNAPKLSD